MLPRLVFFLTAIVSILSHLEFGYSDETNDQNVLSHLTLLRPDLRTGKGRIDKAKFLEFIQSQKEYAGKAGRYGPEFTFSNKKVVDGVLKNEDGTFDVLMKKLELWKAKIQKICEATAGICRVDDDTVQFQDGWWFKVNLDVGVLEVTAKPQTVQEIRENEARLQRFVFDFAREKLDIVPQKSAGSGHIHIDIASTLKNSAVLVRNMYVDIENHPAVFLGALGNSVGNPPIAIQGAETIQNFRKTLEKYDSEVLEKSAFVGEEVKIIRFCEDLLGVERVNPLRERFLSEFKVVNIDHLCKATKFENSLRRDPPSIYTMEIRGLPPQKNAREYSLMTQLFDARAKMLDNKFGHKPIPYLGKSMNLDGKNPMRIIDKHQSVDEFFLYVTGAGLDWKNYKEILNPTLKGIEPKPLVQLKKKIVDELYLFSKCYGQSWTKLKRNLLENIPEMDNTPSSYEVGQCTGCELAAFKVLLDQCKSLTDEKVYLSLIQKRVSDFADSLGVSSEYTQTLLPKKIREMSEQKTGH